MEPLHATITTRLHALLPLTATWQFHLLYIAGLMWVQSLLRVCMFNTAFCFSRSLGISGAFRHLPKIPLNTHFPATQKISNFVPGSLSVRMASDEPNFPKQKQHTQPGKEHVMDPTPQFTSPDYKPSNKLQVYIFIYFNNFSHIFSPFNAYNFLCIFISYNAGKFAFDYCLSYVCNNSCFHIVCLMP